MPSGLIALLDDIATIAKIAAASVDDIGLAVGKAGTKAAGVVIDDTAVTPNYVTGFTPDRELPIIGKIALGSLKNKLLILLPAAMLLVAFAPFLVTPLLMIGGAYLAFEATEKIIEKITGDHHAEAELLETEGPQELEKRQVAGAIRTDFILSAEIMAIALSELEGNGIWMQGFALAAVGIAITVIVYGVVAIIVKLDDIGLHFVKGMNAGAQAFGRGLVLVVPKLLAILSFVGTAAMLWVGGGILVHGLHEMHVLTFIPETVDQAARAIGGEKGFLNWLVQALGGAIVGAVIGGIIMAVLHLILRKRKEPAADQSPG